jgi:hypothetical protein
MCALTFATTLSDSLFAVQTIAPFLVTCALVRQPQRATGWRAIVPHAAILAAALAGIAAYKWVVRHPTRPPSVPGLSHLAANAHDLRDVLAELVSQPPLLGVVLGAWLVVSVAGLVRIVHTGGFARLPRPLLQLLVFALVAAAGNLAAMLLLTYLVVNPRYLIAVALWPLIVVAMLLAHAAPRWCGAASLVLTCVLLLLLGSDAVTAARRPNTEPVAYPATIACIDRALATSGAHHGIAGYWDAKRVQALSRHDLAIAQYLSDLTQHPWITTARYFRPTYDFALINAANGPEYLLPMAQLIAHNGPPAHMAVCDRITVLVYLQDKLAIPAPR